MDKIYHIRDPIHGFIEFNEWERDIINHPAFQRLRKIRQLALTDMVYPGATHSRFEHSLGVMHIATKMFDEICSRRKELLQKEFKFDDTGLGRDRVLLRIASLLHDIGHAPFSHSSEILMPKNSGKYYKHEDYSAAIIKHCLSDLIENHPYNQNYNIKAKDVADFLRGSPSGAINRSLLWRDLLSSQLDADRADYLLRDSHHIGVAYGKYDLERLLKTITLILEADSPKIAVEEGCLHAVEALIIARYMMFTQVYFHKTRRAYDYHLAEVIKLLLRKVSNRKTFLPPTSRKNIDDYLLWTDSKILSSISNFNGKEKEKTHVEAINKREHFRVLYETSEYPNVKDVELFEEKVRKLKRRNIFFIDTAENAWYKFEQAEIKILRHNNNNEEVTLLSKMSHVVKGLKTVQKKRIYCPKDKRDDYEKLLNRKQPTRRTK
ncbi:MAG: HD domain-containing protein [Myxococcota bacterium]